MHGADNNDMTNIADTKEYREETARIQSYVIAHECYICDNGKGFGCGITVSSRNYEYFPEKLKSPKIEYHISGSENTVYKNGKEIYKYTLINDSNRNSIFTH
ncbi:MAG: hypothetical protein FWG90_00840 [Oscillospiraceae bacterium]|nr:hypothetical protein [Oscillospiraceae bacterium]